MKPWDAEALDWDEGNESELADHGISQAEVEQLFDSGPRWVPNKKHRAGDWKMVGYTGSGRAITVVASWDDARAILRPVTGWDCTRGEKTKYLRR
jgi:uncharacterized DUF497 family protein